MLLSIINDKEKAQITDHITDAAVVIIKDHNNKVMCTCEGGMVILYNPHKCKELFKGHWEVVL